MPRGKAKNTGDVLASGKQVYKLSTGVEFTAKSVPSMLIYDAQQQVRMPDPPRVKITQGGQTFWTENSGDPRYIERCEEVQRERNMRALTVMISAGLVLHSKLPESDAWLRKIKNLVDLSSYTNEDGTIDKEEMEYLYLRYYGIQSKEDYEMVANAVSVTEEAVADAVDSFSGDEE
jgi:hypothetical protein